MGQEPAAPPQAGQEPDAAQEPKPNGQEPQGFDALPAETQAEIKKLRAEAASHRREALEAKAKAQEFEDRDKSELEKLTGKLTKTEQAKADAEARLLRYEVAQAKEVPAKLVPLLTATSQADLEAQADLILENAAPATEAAPQHDWDAGGRTPVEPQDDMNARMRKALGHST